MAVPACAGAVAHRGPLAASRLLSFVDAVSQMRGGVEIANGDREPVRAPSFCGLADAGDVTRVGGSTVASGYAGFTRHPPSKPALALRASQGRSARKRKVIKVLASAADGDHHAAAGVTPPVSQPERDVDAPPH